MKAAARRVGRYEILRTVGHGGMATVYLARQTDLDRNVALKELRSFDGADTELARRFLREARLAGSLSHPNIVTVYDYFEDGGSPYIAMEYLPRGSLRPYVGHLPLARIGGVLQGVLAALAHAGRHGIVHRDLKPENMLITEDGWPKIADFGIAKAVGVTQTATNLTATGTTLGTPRYMAPERAMGQEIGPWSDLYSLGIVVFELVAGRTPFQDTDAPAVILMRQINDPIPPLTTVVPGVDPALSEWVERLLVKDPAQRTRSAATAWDELEGILIAALGPRWMDGAALADGPGEKTRATVPLEDGDTSVATVAPATLPLDREGRRPPTRRRSQQRRPQQRRPKPRRPEQRRLRAPVIALLVTGLLAAAALAGTGGRDGGPTAGERSPPQAEAGGGALRHLHRRVRTHAAALAAARTPAARRGAAETLAADYDGAAKALRAGAGDRDTIAALEATAAEYRDAATAAGRGDAGAERAALDRAGARARNPPAPRSGVGDSRSDDPSDDEPDEEDNGD